MSDNLHHRLDLAAEAARAGGEAILRHFQTGVAIELKEDRSPVTAADRDSEAVLLSILSREFPLDSFLGEESGERRGTSGWRWVVDPLDGTKSFIQGVPLFGVMIGLEDPSGEAILGVVCLPALGELVTAAKGEGCRWNGRRAAVSAVGALSGSCVCYTSLKSFEDAGQVPVFEAVHRRARVFRGWGDCYGHVLVATGRAEVMLDPILADWDCAALLPILEEAGGAFTDWKGKRTVRGKSGISMNRALAAEVRAIIDSPPCSAIHPLARPLRGRPEGTDSPGT